MHNRNAQAHDLYILLQLIHLQIDLNLKHYQCSQLRVVAQHQVFSILDVFLCRRYVISFKLLYFAAIEIAIKLYILFANIVKLQQRDRTSKCLKINYFFGSDVQNRLFDYYIFGKLILVGVNNAKI